MTKFLFPKTDFDMQFKSVRAAQLLPQRMIDIQISPIPFKDRIAEKPVSHRRVRPRTPHALMRFSMFARTTDPDTGRLLGLLWLFAVLNVIFRDLHEMTMAGTIEEILSGTLNGNPVTEMVLLAGAFAVELLLLGVLLSQVLPPRLSRRMNLVLPPVAALGTFLAPPNDPDDIFFAIVTLLTFALIFMLAYRWTTDVD